MKQSHHKRHSACGKPPGVTLYHNGNVTRTLFVFPGTQDESMLGDYAREMSTSDRLLMLRKSDQKAARAANMSLGVAPHVQKSAFENLPLNIYSTCALETRFAQRQILLHK
jgi:hypothetical protein